MTDDITIKRTIDKYLRVACTNKLDAKTARIKVYNKVSKELDITISVVSRVADDLKHDYLLKLAILQQQ